MRTKLIAVVVAMLSLGLAFQFASGAQAATGREGPPPTYAPVLDDSSSATFSIQGFHCGGSYILSWEKPTEDTDFYRVYNLNSSGAQEVALAVTNRITIRDDTPDQTFRVVAFRSDVNKGVQIVKTPLVGAAEFPRTITTSVVARSEANRVTTSLNLFC